MQQEQLKEDLVLVGSASYDYVESLRAFLKNKPFVWSSWNFRIREEWRETITNRVKTRGEFPIYLYLSKKRAGAELLNSKEFLVISALAMHHQNLQILILQTPERKVIR